MMPESTSSPRPLAWEPLVFGKTFRADYTYLAVPASFGPDDRAWAEGFLRGSRLQGSYACAFRVARFFLFKNPSYCGVGVTLPASMLSEDKSKTFDFEDREVYVTLGAVARYDEAEFPERPHHPGIPELGVLKRDLRTVFGPVYEEFVSGRWGEETPAESRTLPAVPSQSRTWFPTDLPVISWAPPFALDPDTGLEPDDNDRVNVWPLSMQEVLWSAVCLAKPPISLCLNVMSEKDALAPTSKFGNVILEKSGDKRSLHRAGVNRPTDPSKDILDAAIAEDRPSEENSLPTQDLKRPSLIEIKVFGRKIIDLNFPGSGKR
ncbi:hypothetical protein ACYOEI_02695 [Singulisphaera rosea]